MSGVFYCLDATPRRFQPKNRLDSSPYAGQPVYRPVYAPAESTEATIRGLAGEGFALPASPRLSHSHISTPMSGKELAPASEAAAIEFYPEGGAIKIRRHRIQPENSGGRRGKCNGFSDASRLAMLWTISTLIREEMPMFITLTLPGTTPIPAQKLHRAFENLRMMTRRRFRRASALWKKELKPRLSGELKNLHLPHYHLLAFGLEDEITWQEYQGDWVQVWFDQAAGKWIVRLWMLNERGEKVIAHEEERTPERKDRLRR